MEMQQRFDGDVCALTSSILFASLAALTDSPFHLREFKMREQI